MKIAWFSPLSPQPSGISDYCEELLPALARHAEIDLWIDPAWKPDKTAINERFPIYPYTESSFPAEKYDQLVYHMGNDYGSHRFVHQALSRHPGVVVLHDLVLMGFYAAREDAGHRFSDFIGFLQRFYPRKADWIAEQCGGRHPFPIWEGELALQLPKDKPQAMEPAELEARLADPATYEDANLSRELGQRFSTLQVRAEDIMSDLAYLEKEMQELELQRDA